MIVPGTMPRSVAKGDACEICWRPHNNAIRYIQTLDGVSRSLCESCLSRMYPRLPPKLEKDPKWAGARVVHLDAAAMLAEAEERASHV